MDTNVTIREGTKLNWKSLTQKSFCDNCENTLSLTHTHTHTNTLTHKHMRLIHSHTTTHSPSLSPPSLYHSKTHTNTHQACTLFLLNIKLTFYLTHIHILHLFLLPPPSLSHSNTHTHTHFICIHLPLSLWSQIHTIYLSGKQTNKLSICGSFDSRPKSLVLYTPMSLLYSSLFFFFSLFYFPSHFLSLLILLSMP
jgi:hypothetical protein